jgi:uncharacterized protein (TIGR02118 family)
MVRLLVLYQTPSDPEAFWRHYREVHIPLAHKLTGLRRYTLSRDSIPLRGGEPYFLVAELDWDSMAELRAAFATPEGRATGEDAAILEQWSPGMHSMIYELEEV